MNHTVSPPGVNSHKPRTPINWQKPPKYERFVVIDKPGPDELSMETIGRWLGSMDLGGTRELGLWVPKWVRKAVNTEATAMVFSFLLMMGDASGHTQGDERVTKFNGVGVARSRHKRRSQFWTLTSTRAIARRTGLSQPTVTRSVRWLVKKELIAVMREGNDTFMRILGVGTGQAYWRVTKSEVAKREWVDTAWISEPTWVAYDFKSPHAKPIAPFTWFESETRIEAMNHSADVTSPGTYVPWIFSESLKDPGLARMLSQIFFRFINTHGRSTADFKHAETGKMFMKGSDRNWQKSLGIDRTTALRWRALLVRKGLIYAVPGTYRGKVNIWNRTCFVRPNGDAVVELCRPAYTQIMNRLEELTIEQEDIAPSLWFFA